MRSQNQQPKVIVFWTLLICFLILGSAFLKLLIAFSQSTLKRLERISFVLTDLSSEVIVFSLQGKEGLILSLDGKNKVQLPRGYGEYELAKVYPLGELDGKGGQLLKETVQFGLQVPVFGFFYDESNFTYRTMEPKKFFSTVFERALEKKIQTDLRMVDLVFFYLRSRALNEAEIKTKNLPEDTLDLFKDGLLRREGYSIEVLNSTNHSGLAQQVTGLLEKSGARVVRTADEPQGRERSLLIVPSQLCQSYTFKWLALVFDFEVEKSEEKERADFTLVLGEEYGEEIKGKIE